MQCGDFIKKKSKSNNILLCDSYFCQRLLAFPIPLTRQGDIRSYIVLNCCKKEKKKKNSFHSVVVFISPAADDFRLICSHSGVITELEALFCVCLRW